MSGRYFIGTSRDSLKSLCMSCIGNWVVNKFLSFLISISHSLQSEDRVEELFVKQNCPITLLSSYRKTFELSKSRKAVISMSRRPISASLIAALELSYTIMNFKWKNCSTWAFFSCNAMSHSSIAFCIWLTQRTFELRLGARSWSKSSPKISNW